MASTTVALKWGSATLADAGVPSPQNDARALLAFVLNCEPRDFLGHISDREVPETSYVEYESLVARRCQRVPLQHLVGVAYFRNLELQVGPGVFIPRPETELLTQAGIDFLNPIHGRRVAVELCAGSAAVGLSVATEVENVDVYAVELSSDAHSWLEKNHHKYAQQIAIGNSTFTSVNADATHSDLLADLNGTVDVVLCNPPYIPEGMIPREPEVREYDPALALYGGPDGLAIVRELLPVCHRLLRQGGLVAIEHADVQGESLPALLSDAKQWTDIADHRDYNQRPRFTVALKA